MVYGYIRISTDKQTVENQRYEITSFCKRNELTVDKWVQETISGTRSVYDRKLGKLLKLMKKGDILVCSELSRLGRNLLMIMSVLNECMSHCIQVWTIKDNYRLGNDINCKILAFAFGLSAEIERELLSQRTREALARRRSEGKVLGRPKGAENRNTILTSRKTEIKALFDKKMSISAVAKILGVHRLTVARFVKSSQYQRKC